MARAEAARTDRQPSNRWIFQQINEAEWMVATDENRRVSSSSSTMSKLFFLSDLLRKARGSMGESGLFALSEAETKEWLRDCYGISEVEQKSPILTHEVLVRILVFAETPRVECNRTSLVHALWRCPSPCEATPLRRAILSFRAKHEVIRFQRAHGCISLEEKARVMKTLNHLRGRLIDASSGARRHDGELGSIRDHILRIADVAVSSSDPRFSSLVPLLASLRRRTEDSMQADELSYLENKISPVIATEEQDLLQDLCFIAKFRKALEERFDSKDVNVSDQLSQLVADAEQKEDRCLRAGFQRDHIKSLVNVGRALGIPALLKQCNAYYMWEREGRRGTSTGLSTTSRRSNLAINLFHGAPEVDCARKGAKRDRELNLKGGWSDRSTLPDVDECVRLDLEPACRSERSTSR
eukprot:1105873-Rhodomonas_salina.1